jgi:HEAT repeat protein
MSFDKTEQDQFDHLISLLNDPDPDTRGMVATGLGKIRAVQAVNPLVALLSDNTERVRIAVIRSLGEIGNRTAVEPLLPLLQDPSSEVRAAVLLAFTQLPDERAFGSVVVALFDANDEVRKNAAAAIGGLGDERALEPLLVCLDDSYPWVRANAIWSLGALRLAAATQPLIDLLAVEKDEAVLSNAIVSLGRIGASEGLRRVLSVLQDGAQPARQRIAAAIAFGEYYEERSVSAVASKPVTSTLPESTKAATPRHPEQDQTPGISAARADSTRTESAASACASHRAATSKGASPQILQDLRAALLELLRNASDDELRATAAWTLGRLPSNPAIVDALIAALADPYEWVVSYAVESLALQEDPRALEPLGKLIECGGERSFVDRCNATIEHLTSIR